MRKLLFISGIIFCIFLITACSKYPKVKTVSAVVDPDGTVLVSAEVILEKRSKMESVGFCMDTLPEPNALSNQKIETKILDSKFSTVYSQKFNSNKTYYFRSWIKKDKGYTYGNVVSLSDIKASSIIVPCSLDPNTAIMNCFTHRHSINSVTAVKDPSSTRWTILATSPDTTFNIKITFASEPRTKLYTPSIGYVPGENFVIVNVSSGSYSGQLMDGQVYVNEISHGVFEIAICRGTWNAYTSSSRYPITADLKAKFTSPLK